MQNILTYLNKDLRELFLSLYLRIEIRYRISFLITLLITCFSFSIFIFHHPLHNHSPRFPWIDFSDQLFQNRWFSLVWFSIANFADVPVFIPILSCIISVMTSLLTIKIWESHSNTRNLSISEICIIASMISIYPAMLAAYYFTWQTLLFSGGMLLAALGIHTARNNNYISIIPSSLLILFAMASYQPILSVILTLVASIIILSIANSALNKTSNINFFFSNKLLLLSVLTGLVLYRISFILLNIKAGDTFATRTISLEDYPSRILEVIAQSFISLIDTQPELLNPVKTILLFFCVLAFLILSVRVLTAHTARNKKAFFFLMLLVSVLLVVISTKGMYLLSPTNKFMNYRYNFATGFLYAFAVYITISSIKIRLIYNVVLVLSFFIVLRYAQADLVRQGVLLRGQQHDIAFANRILSRIETIEGIDLNKKYHLVRTAKYSNFRKNLLTSKDHNYSRYGGDQMDKGEVSEIWAAGKVMELIGSKVKFHGYDSSIYKKIRKAISIAKEQNRKPWPHQSSVFIHQDWIIVYIESKE